MPGVSSPASPISVRPEGTPRPSSGPASTTSVHTSKPQESTRYLVRYGGGGRGPGRLHCTAGSGARWLAREDRAPLHTYRGLTVTSLGPDGRTPRPWYDLILAGGSLLRHELYLDRVRSMKAVRRPSPETIAVFLALAEEPARWTYGYDLCRSLGLKAGTVYPILIRLAERGHLQTAWEQDVPSGRPPRHLYRLSHEGAELAAQLRGASTAADRATLTSRPALEGSVG